jgi:hypothetical protein
MEMSDTDDNKKLSPFTFVDSISFSKKDFFRDEETSAVAEKAYSSFMVNRALSYHPDTLLYANEMNTKGHLDDLLQHDYLINTVRPRKRKSSKWPKPFKDKDVEVVMEYYSCNYNKANQILEVLTEEQLSMLRARTYKGGNDNDNRNGRGSSKES